MKKLRTVVAVAHRIYRHTLLSGLGRLEEITLVGEATEGEEALRLVAELDPDLLILDLDVQNITGSQVAAYLQGQPVDVKIIALFDYPLEMFAVGLEPGDSLILLAKENAEGLLATIRALATEMDASGGA